MAAVNELLFIEAYKGFAYSTRKAVIEGETLARPITGDAHTTLLVGDAVEVFVFPGPHLLHKLFPAEFLATDAVLGQFAFHYVLCGNTGMIGARHPQGSVAQHTMVASEGIFNRGGDCMAQDAGCR